HQLRRRACRQRSACRGAAVCQLRSPSRLAAEASCELAVERSGRLARGANRRSRHSRCPRHLRAWRNRAITGARQRKLEMSEVKQQWREQGVVVPMAKSSALAMNGGSPVGAYLAQHAVGTSGTFIKFAKDGVYRKQADDVQIPTGTEVAV